VSKHVIFTLSPIVFFDKKIHVFSSGTSISLKTKSPAVNSFNDFTVICLIIRQVKIILSELRQIILTELRAMSENSYYVDSDDLMSMLKLRANPWSKLRNVDLYVPFRYVDKLVDTNLTTDLQRLQVLREKKVKPKDILDLLKVLTVNVSNTVFYTDQKSQDIVFKIIARKIAAAFQDEVDLVTAPESGSRMASYLASEVARHLNVQYAPNLLQKKTASELSIDEPRFKEFSSRALSAGQNNDYVTRTRSRLEKHLQNWRRAGTKPETKKLPHEWRKFFNMHKFSGDQSVVGRSVLVVDDNVDKGETLGAVEQELLSAGASKVFLAAGWDYSQRV